MFWFCALFCKYLKHQKILHKKFIIIIQIIFILILKIKIIFVELGQFLTFPRVKVYTPI